MKMKVLLLIILIALAVSCSVQEIKIKNAEADSEIKEISIKTAKAEIKGNHEQIKLQPALSIISPIESKLIRNSTIIVGLQAENFKAVPIGSQVRDNEGHFHIWLDSEKRVTADSTSVFENVGAGRHSIVAELVKSNHSSLTPKVVKSLSFSVEAPEKPKPLANLREYSIEADDSGFYPSRIMSKIGDNVTIQFKFRNALIYYAGLDVKGPFPDIRYGIGDEQPISRSFIMSEETIIKSFWPSTGVKKADLVVEVEK